MIRPDEKLFGRIYLSVIPLQFCKAVHFHHSHKVKAFCDTGLMDETNEVKTQAPYSIPIATNAKTPSPRLRKSPTVPIKRPEGPRPIAEIIAEVRLEDSIRAHRAQSGLFGPFEDSSPPEPETLNVGIDMISLQCFLCHSTHDHDFIQTTFPVILDRVQ